MAWRSTITTPSAAGGQKRCIRSGPAPIRSSIRAANCQTAKYADAVELKHLLLDDTDKFAAAFTDKLATYALRRGMTFSDRVELKCVAEKAKADGYKLQTLIESLVTSDLFQKR